MTMPELNAEILTCRRCPRLVAWREEVARQKRRAYRDWEYWGKPVPGFGDPCGRVLVVGLAPGAHGSNRTGRMFTGDASGDFLYPALFRSGFASQPDSTDLQDGLSLKDIYITAVCRCAPPGNRPAVQEMANCRSYLQREIALIGPRIFVALGRVAFDNLLHLNPSRRNSAAFSHGAVHPLDHDRYLVASYHPSRQNTQTGRLTVEMFDRVWETVGELLKQELLG
jgi:uracil-DNA glycosylase family 4